MRIPSGTTDRYIYFVAVDPTDLKTRETGLTTFTVYRSRNGGVAAAMTTPTINETSLANMPGVYELLLDEDTTLTAGNDTEEMVLHITQASMAPVTRVVELYRPETTEGNTLDVTATGAAGIDWNNVENQSTSVDLSATAINLCDTTTAVTNTVTADVDTIKTQTVTCAAGVTVGVYVGGTAASAVETTAQLILTDTGTTLETHLTDIKGTAFVKDTHSLVNIEGYVDLIDDGTSGLAKIATDAAAILVDTAQIGAAGAGLTALATQASVDTIDGIVDAILLDTAEIGTAGVGLSNIPWNASWDAEVESEVNDAIDTAISELTVAAPTATPTLRTGLMLLYMMARNKTVVQTSGTDALEIYNDAGTKIASKLLTDDGSDYTEAEMA